jgi:hypothetical protein
MSNIGSAANAALNSYPPRLAQPKNLFTHVWNETEYQRVSGVLQHGFDEFARDPDSKAISEIEFVEAAEWIWNASIASARCTESELVAAADSLKAAVASADEA